MSVSCTSHGSRPAASYVWLLGLKNIIVTPNSTQQSPVYNVSTDTYTVTSTLTYTVDRTYNRQHIKCQVSNLATSEAVTSTVVIDVRCKYGFTIL